ncbi:MAG TPA: hypothetical protein VFP50_18225 [Anaeromyxobacteraceae bacterium]|nr:hypothetical protein [Anaeromyxobacteraceae bacterium]
MATNVTTAQLAGLFKEAYAGGVRTLYPEMALISKEIGELTEAERVGNLYHQPVILTREQGYTYGGSSGDAYALAASVAMSMQDAQLQGVENTLRSRVPMRVAAKSVSSAKAFKQAIGLILKSNLSSHALRKEKEILYGGATVGMGQSASMNNDSTTQTTIAISPATWATGLWAGEEQATVNFFRTDTGALISSAADAVFTLTAIDPDNRKITVTGTTTGTTALQAQAANATVVFSGARTTLSSLNEAIGLHYISNVAGGTTVWNISNTNTLWKPNSYSCASGALTFGKIVSGMQRPVAKAALDENVTLYCSIDTWPSLVDSFAAARLLDSSYTPDEYKNGAGKVSYVYGPAVVKVAPHPMVMGGHAFAVPSGESKLKKVGSTDVTLNVPGRGDEMFTLIPDANGFEFRSYSDWAPFAPEPAKIVQFTNIVNP